MPSYLGRNNPTFIVLSFDWVPEILQNLTLFSYFYQRSCFDNENRSLVGYYSL